MTVHRAMFDTLYPSPLVWCGVWETPTGLVIDGFHLWNRKGAWIGVYHTYSRAVAQWTEPRLAKSGDDAVRLPSARPIFSNQTA